MEQDNNKPAPQKKGKFTSGKLKRMMQEDEDVGSISKTTLTIMGKAVELVIHGWCIC